MSRILLDRVWRGQLITSPLRAEELSFGIYLTWQADTQIEASFLLDVSLCLSIPSVPCFPN